MLKLPTHSGFHDLYLNYSTSQYFPVDLMDLLFNQVKKIYNSTLADLETSYHLLTSIYYKNSLNVTMSLKIVDVKIQPLIAII
jgi:hypothetical protein